MIASRQTFVEGPQSRVHQRISRFVDRVWVGSDAPGVVVYPTKSHEESIQASLVLERHLPSKCVVLDGSAFLLSGEGHSITPSLKKKSSRTAQSLA